MRFRTMTVVVALGLGLATTAGAVPLKDLVAGGGSVTVGGVTFRNFRIGTPPSPNPQGAQPNDGVDVDVTGRIDPLGVTLLFTSIDPLTGTASPLRIDAAAGPHDLIRHTLFDVEVTSPNLVVSALVESLGAGTAASGDCSVVDMTYLMDPAVGIVQFESAALGSVQQAGRFVLSAPSAILTVDQEWEMDSSHHGGVRQGQAQLDAAKLSFVLASSVAGVSPASVGGGLELAPNAPNPFSGATTIRFRLPSASPARLDVFDARGGRVAHRSLPAMAAGWQSLSLERGALGGRALPNGTYYYRVEAAGASVTGRMVVLR